MASHEEVSIKVLIEAENRAEAAYAAQKKHTQDLMQQQKELQKLLDQDQQAYDRGNKAKQLSAKEFFATTTKAHSTLADEIAKSTRMEVWTYDALKTAQDKHTKATEDANRRKEKSIHGVTGALTHYLKHFVSIAAAEETIRRSIEEYAHWERGMARIEIQTGQTSKGVEHLGHSFDRLARLTGASVGDLQKSFLSFQAGIGEMNHDVEHVFEDIVETSYAAGVSVDSMARTAVAAIKTMNVPYGEVKDVLASVAREIPASAMGAWDNAAPKILSAMRSIGNTGATSITQAARAFGMLNVALGGGAAAGDVYNRMLQRSIDQSTLFGKVMTQQMVANRGAADEELKYHQAFRNLVVQLGAVDPSNPQRALAMRQMHGITEEEILANEKVLELWREINETAARTHRPIDEVRDSIMRLRRGPQQVLDELKGSFGEMLTALGKFMGTSISDTLNNWFTGIAIDVERVNILLEKFRTLTGTRTVDPATGAVREDAMGDRFHAWWIQQLTGMTRQQQDEQARGPGMAWGKDYFGIPDAIMNWLFGGHDPGRLQEERRRRGGTGTTRPPQLGGRGAVPSTAPRPGYATGGEFVVGGQGGVDSQPVEFMATPGERVAVTTPLAESLQQQQDKADLAMREYLARFRPRAAARTGLNWWPSSSVREPGPGSGGAQPSMAGGGGGADRTGTRPGGGNQPDLTTPPTTTTPGGVPFIGPDGQPSANPNAPVAGQAVVGGGGTFDPRGSAGVDPRLVAAVRAGAESLPPGYRVVVTSGFRRGDPRNHGRGLAMDVQIIRPDGTRIQNYGEERGPRNADPSGLYTQMARVGYGYMLTNHPDLARRFGWGGSFPIPQAGAWNGRPDTMHYSLNNEHGRWAQYRPYNLGPLYPGQAPSNPQQPTQVAGPWPGGAVPGGQPIPGGPWVMPPPSGGGQPAGTGGSASQYSAAVAAGTATPAQTYAEFRRLAAEAGSTNPDLTAAIAMHESGAGDPNTRRSVYISSGRTNPFGQTGTGPAGSVPGADRQQHKVYRNLREAFEDHVRGTHGARGGRGWAAAYVPNNPQQTLRNLRALGYNTAQSTWLAGVLQRYNQYRNTPQLPTAAAAGPFTGPAVPHITPPAASPVIPPSSITPVTPPREPPAQAWPRVLPETQAAYERSQRGIDRHSAHARMLGRVRTAAAEGAEGRAEGGPVRAGRDYIVGEDGPEVFKPNVPGSVLPGSKSSMDDMMERNQIQSRSQQMLQIGPGVSDALMEYRQLAAELAKPIRANIEIPRSGPIRHRASRRIERQREIDVGQMTREAAHSDIGMQ